MSGSILDVSGSIHPPDHSRNVGAGPALVTLLAVQIIIGYEWVASGITKVASGTFVSGLAADLKEQAQESPHWYRSFLHDSIIPNARAFGVLIEVGELIVGVGFMLAAIVWLARWSRLSDRWRMSLLWVTMLSALGATFMAINFHVASGANNPWLIPADGFDETIDVDTVLALIQAAFFIFSGYLLLKIHREQPTKKAAGVQLGAEGLTSPPALAMSTAPTATVSRAATSHRGASEVASQHEIGSTTGVLELEGNPATETAVHTNTGAAPLAKDNDLLGRYAHDGEHHSRWRRSLFVAGISAALMGAVRRLVKR